MQCQESKQGQVNTKQGPYLWFQAAFERVKIFFNPNTREKKETYFYLPEVILSVDIFPPIFLTIFSF